MGGLWIRIHFMRIRIRIQQFFWMRIRIQVQVQLNQIWRNNGACANLNLNNFIKLQLLVISLHFFSF